MTPGGVRVEARGWGWRYAGRRAWALRGLDLVVEPGERVLLLAPSGGGKSTLLAALAGLLDPAHGGEAQGSLTVDGLDPRSTRARSGLVLQDPETGVVMARAGDDVAFGLENAAVPLAALWPRVAAALETVGWPYPLDRRTDTLSGGELQRLVVAGLLARQPGLVLLDEPTANLDPYGAELVRTALRATLDATGATGVLVEHRVAEALPLVDRVVVLEAGGGVVADGPPEAVFAEHGARLAARGVWLPGPLPASAPPRRPTAEPLLSADRVGLRYRGMDAPALAPVSLTVHAAQVLAITGPNGSGKSTLVTLLAGLERPTTGRVQAEPALADTDADTEPHRWRARALAARIGTVFQDPEHQFLTGRVRDELALGPRRTGRDAATTARTVDDLLARLHLERLADANPFTLSGGEKRRLSVATALATAPRLLVLDEPTFGQDRRTWAEVVGLLAAHRDGGGAVCLATHDLDLVTALGADELALRRVPEPAP